MLKERISFYDNLKFLLIVFVVIGHFQYFILNLRLASSFYTYIYMFHMPLFIFITGFLSKKLTDKDDHFRLEKVLNFILIYLLFKLAIYFILNVVFKQNIEVSIVTERDTPWYLLALSLWLPMTFILKRIKVKYLLPVLFVISILAGYDTEISDVLCLSRVIVFYPYFLIGYYVSERQLDEFISKLHDKKNRIIFGAILVIVFLLTLLFPWIVCKLNSILTGQNPYIYTELPQSIPFAGALSRVSMYFIQIVMSLAVLSFIPRRKLFFTKYGERTMQVYVLHYLFILIFVNTKFHLSLMNFFGNFLPLVYSLLAIFLTFVLSNHFFKKIFDKISNISYQKFFE